MFTAIHDGSRRVRRGSRRRQNHPSSDLRNRKTRMVSRAFHRHESSLIDAPFGLLSSLFGIVALRIPSLKEASIRSVFALDGSLKERLNGSSIALRRGVRSPFSSRSLFFHRRMPARDPLRRSHRLLDADLGSDDVLRRRSHWFVLQRCEHRGSGRILEEPPHPQADASQCAGAGSILRRCRGPQRDAQRASSVDPRFLLSDMADSPSRSGAFGCGRGPSLIVSPIPSTQCQKGAGPRNLRRPEHLANDPGQTPVAGRSSHPLGYLHLQDRLHLTHPSKGLRLMAGLRLRRPP